MGKLVWLASYPKSGNTWLRAFLHNYLRNAAEPHPINSLLDLTATENDGSSYRPFDPRPASSYTIEDVQRMRPLVHRVLTESFPDYVFVKTHNAAVSVAGVKLQTPDVTAASIYVVRDPRDVAVSYSHHLGRPVDEVIALMADPRAAIGGNDEHVFEWLGDWSSHVRSWAGQRDPRRLVLRYEDMHVIPEQCFGIVARFLGAAPDPQRLAKAIEFSRFERLQAQERAEGFVERPATAEAFFRAGRVGQWREVLTADQAERIRHDHAAVMTAFRYSEAPAAARE